MGQGDNLRCGTRGGFEGEGVLDKGMISKKHLLNLSSHSLEVTVHDTFRRGGTDVYEMP